MLLHMDQNQPVDFQAMFHDLMPELLSHGHGMGTGFYFYELCHASFEGD